MFMWKIYFFPLQFEELLEEHHGRRAIKWLGFNATHGYMELNLEEIIDLNFMYINAIQVMN